MTHLLITFLSRIVLLIEYRQLKIIKKHLTFTVYFRRFENKSCFKFQEASKDFV